MSPEFYIVRLYRSSPGDLNLNDWPLSALEDVEAQAGKLLLSYHGDTWRGAKPPLRADVLGERNEVLMTLYLSGPDKVARLGGEE